MIGVLFLVLQISSIVTSESAANMQESGWIPLSREEALNRFRNSHRHYSPVQSTRMQILRENAIAVVVPETPRLETFNFGPENIEFTRNHANSNECQFGACLSNVENNYKASVNEETSKNMALNNNVRKSKAIRAYTSQANNLNDRQSTANLEYKVNSKLDPFVTDNSNDTKSNANLENNVKSKLDPFVTDNEIIDDSEQESQHTYEVIENNETFPKNQQRQPNIDSGYKYQSKKDNFLPRNLTHTFLNILNGYNIKPEDELANYVLSRNKGNIVKQNYIFVPMLNIPRGYNSLNHQPVDPLIAVFLSNYGYYLPSYYGVHNNYSNHYGYLASNNIHNNLPFGLYKVFSDTDSSL